MEKFNSKIKKITQLVHLKAQRKDEGEYALVATMTKHAFRDIMEVLSKNDITSLQFKDNFWFLTTTTKDCLTFKEFCNFMEIPVLFKETKKLILKEIKMAKQRKKDNSDITHTRKVAFNSYVETVGHRKALDKEVNELKKQEKIFLNALGVDPGVIEKQIKIDNSPYEVYKNENVTLLATLKTRSSIDELAMLRVGIDVSKYKINKSYLKYTLK